jgi:hypothetical protein
MILIITGPPFGDDVLAFGVLTLLRHGNLLRHDVGIECRFSGAGIYLSLWD